MSGLARLRHLKALQVFVAVCDEGGFTAAARTLSVSQAAVSQQIRLLEDWLGVPLFIRNHHQLTPTPAAMGLLPLAREGFGLLARGVDQVLAQDDPHRLTVTALPSFTSRWLVPRLGRFMDRHEIQVHLVPVSTLLDYEREGIDVGIRFGRGEYPGLEVELLSRDQMFPVYNPQRLKIQGAIEHPADLFRQRLIIDEGWHNMSWERWFEAAGVKGWQGRPAAVITDAGMLIDAAVRGQGVALVRRSLAQEELDAGRLVAPFDVRLTTEFSYYVVVPPHKRRLPKVAAFMDWLRDEVGQADGLCVPA